jgi:glutamine cyclotransferase
MMIINAQSGAIEGVVNLGGLKQRVKQHTNLDVLNGIAYHPDRKTLFVTGKNWDKIFEVRLIEK